LGQGRPKEADLTARTRAHGPADPGGRTRIVDSLFRTLLGH
jgi:hypothetical protein